MKLLFLLVIALIAPLVVSQEDSKQKLSEGKRFSLKLTDDEFLQAVKATCPFRNKMCPFKKFALIKEPIASKWDETAVLKSEERQEFNKRNLTLSESFQFLREKFCCWKEDCLHNCGIFKRPPFQLADKFPENVEKIFELDIPGLQYFRPYIDAYIEKYGMKKTMRHQRTAEIEEYFDFLHANKERIWEELKRKEDPKIPI